MRQAVDGTVGSLPNFYSLRDPALMIINIRSYKLGFDPVHDVAISFIVVRYC